MNLVIHQSAPHTTHDGYPATYALVFDTLTAERVGMLQIVELGDGAAEYRTTDQRSLPPDFSWDDAIRFAVADQTRRKTVRPTRPAKPQRLRWQRRTPWYVPPKPIRPMRQLLVAKIAMRNGSEVAA